MEVQRAQAGRNVGVHLVLHSLPLDPFVAIGAATSRPGTHTHPHHPGTVLDWRRGGWERSRNPVRCIHVCKFTHRLKPGRTIAEADEWAVSATVTVSCQTFLSRDSPPATAGPRPWHCCNSLVVSAFASAWTFAVGGRWPAVGLRIDAAARRCAGEWRSRAMTRSGTSLTGLRWLSAPAHAADTFKSNSSLSSAPRRPADP